MRGGMVALLAVAALGATVPAEALVLCGPKARGTGELKNGATLRVRAACTGKEVQVDADAVGLRGPQGAQGTPGTPGADGAAGAPGLAGVEVVTANGNAIISGFATSTATAECPSGKTPIAGGHGYQVFGAWNVYPWVAESRPVLTDPKGWTVAAQGQASDDWWVVAYAVCANVAP